MGVFRSVAKPTYEQMMAEQLDTARAERAADLDALLTGSDTWTVEAATPA
jgi:2-oxoglutarate ferredoxin oxidoreductase subunit beta